MISNILHDLRFSLNEPLQSADKCYIGILQNVIKTYEYVDFFFTYFEFSLDVGLEMVTWFFITEFLKSYM